MNWESKKVKCRSPLSLSRVRSPVLNSLDGTVAAKRSRKWAVRLSLQAPLSLARDSPTDPTFDCRCLRCPLSTHTFHLLTLRCFDTCTFSLDTLCACLAVVEVFPSTVSLFLQLPFVFKNLFCVLLKPLPMSHSSARQNRPSLAHDRGNWQTNSWLPDL